MNGYERCNRYVDDVLEGTIPAPQTIIRACDRYLKDWENPKLTFDTAAAAGAVAAIETLHHAKGRWQGKPLVLEDCQCFAVCNLFGWKWKDTKLRRFRYAYWQFPRKNGKTLLAISVALVMFGPDREPGAEVLLGATSMDHSKDLLFHPAKYVVEHSDDYRQEFGIEVNASNMVIPANFSTFKTVIKKPDDGANPHCAVVDEFHLHDSDEMWSVFDTGMGAREQPLLLTTTTAGFSLGGPCHIYRDDMLKLLNGEFEDDSTFVLIYEPDPDDEWDDPDVLRKVNPLIDVSVSEAFLMSQLAQARRSAEKQSAFRTKHLNEWVGAKTQFMNMVAWQKQRRELELEQFLGEKCHVAVDLAEQKDASSVAVMFRRPDGYYCFATHFVPEAAFEWNDKYRTFALQGLINVTEGNAQDYDEIKAHIDSLADRFDVQSIRFDPWQSAQMMQEIQATGLTVYKQTQQFSDFSDAMKTLETAVLDGEFFHAGDPVLTWMMGNTAAMKNKDDHIKPVKGSPNNPMCKIDGAVATIMCMKGFIDEGPEPEYRIRYA